MNRDKPEQHDPQPERPSEKNPWRSLEKGLDLFTEDFVGERDQPEAAEEREPL